MPKVAEGNQLYFGGEICTMDPSLPSASAVAVVDGWIAAVGSESDCRAVLGRRFEAIDIDGGVMVPGFIDTHFHPAPLIFYDMNADLTEVHSLEEMARVLRQTAERTPKKNWVVGLRFDEQNLPSGRMPTRQEL